MVIEHTDKVWEEGYLQRLYKQYPLESIPNEFKKIEYLEYGVITESDYVSVYRPGGLGDLVIDSDRWVGNFHANAAEAITAFWGLKEVKKTSNHETGRSIL